MIQSRLTTLLFSLCWMFFGYSQHNESDTIQNLDQEECELIQEICRKILSTTPEALPELKENLKDNLHINRVLDSLNEFLVTNDDALLDLSRSVSSSSSLSDIEHVIDSMKNIINTKKASVVGYDNSLHAVRDQLFLAVPFKLKITKIVESCNENSSKQVLDDAEDQILSIIMYKTTQDMLYDRSQDFQSDTTSLCVIYLYQVLKEQVPEKSWYQIFFETFARDIMLYICN